MNYSDWLSAKITQEKELKLKMIENNKQIIKLVLNHKNITRQQAVKQYILVYVQVAII